MAATSPLGILMERSVSVEYSCQEVKHKKCILIHQAQRGEEKAMSKARGHDDDQLWPHHLVSFDSQNKALNQVLRFVPFHTSETKAQRSQVTHPRSHSECAAELKLECM